MMNTSIQTTWYHHTLTALFLTVGVGALKGMVNHAKKVKVAKERLPQATRLDLTFKAVMYTLFSFSFKPITEMEINLATKMTFVIAVASLVQYAWEKYLIHAYYISIGHS